MENSLIVQGNKLIALFMGATIKNNKELWLPIFGICNYNNINLGNGKILQYNSSYDWIIPVLNKIYSTDDYFIYINEVSGQIPFTIELNIKHISSTWVEIVEFLEWYNKNK